MNDSLDKLSATIKSFPSLDANGMEDNLLKMKVAYPCRNARTIESFYEPLKWGRDYFSSLEESDPDFEERLGTQKIVVKNKITVLEELTLLYLKNDVFLLTDFSQNYIDTCKSA